MHVPVLDHSKIPQAPTSPRRARLLLAQGKAAVFKHFPFTIILKREVVTPVAPLLYLKIDPGSKVTGLAIVNQTTGEIVFAAEIHHHGSLIQADLLARSSVRRGRRNRQTRYREPRFHNRTRKAGWLPPSLLSRVANVETWVRRLLKLYPIAALVVESVRFDMQKIQHPEIEGVEYQQGELAGYELRQYLLIKFKHQCQYSRDPKRKSCSPALEIEHIQPRSRGGSRRVGNLTIACHKHNQQKGARTAAEFGFPEVQEKATKPLRDAAAVNSTRKILVSQLTQFGLPVEEGTGGLTKFNRIQRNLLKTHWLDAACVGISTPATLLTTHVKPLIIKSMGFGNRQIWTTDKFGFPKSHKGRVRTFAGFRTGDMVRANIPKGKYAGQHVGRVTIRQRNWFLLNGINVHPKHLTRIQRADGHAYNPIATQDTSSPRALHSATEVAALPG